MKITAYEEGEREDDDVEEEKKETAKNIEVNMSWLAKNKGEEGNEL